MSKIGLKKIVKIFLVIIMLVHVSFLNAENCQDMRVKESQIIDAMQVVSPEKFIQEQEVQNGSIISPYMLAYMIGLLNLTGKEKLLEIGISTGYNTAVLSYLVPYVLSIEFDAERVEQVNTLLKSMGIFNVSIKSGNAWFGWQEQAPFDAIFVTYVVAKIPKELIKQLAEGGKMIVRVGTTHQKLALITKIEGRVKTRFIDK